MRIITATQKKFFYSVNVLAQRRPKAVRWSAGLGVAIPQHAEKYTNATKDSCI